MKIRIKPLKGKEFFLDDVQAVQTIGEIKKMIENQEGPAFPAEALKVILLGKVLKDDRTLESTKFDENKNYLVLVVGKKRKQKPKAPEPAPVAEAPAETAQPPAPATNDTAAPAQPNTPAQPRQGPVITDEAVQNLASMGFVESDARAALEAAFGNPQVAVEFLMNPAAMDQAIQRNQAIQNPNPPAAAENLTPMQQFQRSPDFQRVRQALNTNPGAMGEVLRGIQTSNPALFQEITQNRESMAQFVELLSGDDEGVPDTGGGNPFGDIAAAVAGVPGGLPGLPGLGAGGGAPDMNMVMQLLQMMQQLPAEQRNALLQRFGIPPEALGTLMEGLAGAGAGGAGAGAAGAIPRPPRATIQLTEEEHAAIGRLQELGFSRRACIEAYLACDKNETLAANFLFNNPPEEDAGPPPPPAANNNNNGNPAGDI